MFPIGAQVAGASPAATWSTLSPPARPPALAYAAEAYDPAIQKTVLFGGVDSSGNLSDATWIWDGTTWSEARTLLSGPAPRELASMAYLPAVPGQTQGQLILFGGAGAGDAPLGDTWAFNGQSWVSMSASSSTGPAPRFGASLAEDATGDLVLFGGTGSASTGAKSAETTPPQTSAQSTAGQSTTTPSTTATSGQSSTHAASASTASTLPATSATPSTTPTLPTATAAKSAVATASVTVDGTTTLDDTWVWNGSAWNQPNIMSGPSPRTSGALVWDPELGQTVLFGGSATPTAIGPATPLGDTWVWSGSAWTEVTQKLARSPSARYDAASGSAGALGGDVLIGGNNGLGPFSDQWKFTGDTWSPIGVTGALTARSGAATAGNPASGGLMVFGGVGARGNLDDTTLLSATPPLQVTTTPGGGPGSTNGSQPGTSGPLTENGSTSSAPGSSASDPASRATSTTHRGAAPTSATDRATTTGQSTSVSDEPGSHARIVSGGSPGTGGTEPSASQSGLTTSPPLQTVHTGSLVTVLGSGFEPGAMVTITFHSRPYTIGRTIAGPDGTFSATVTVPLEASPGHHHLEASGMGPQGRMTVLLTPIVVLGKATHSLGGTSTQTKLIMVGIAVLLPASTWVITGIWSKRRRRPMTAA
jgi:hypothetical protein